MTPEGEGLSFLLLEDEALGRVPLDVWLSDDLATALDFIIEFLTRAGAEKHG